MEEHDLLGCIDKALDSFGPTVRQTVFWKMIILHNKSGAEVITDPDVFVQVLNETFSDSSAKIQESIVREIRKTFDLQEDTLVSAVTAAREKMATHPLVRG